MDKEQKEYLDDAFRLLEHVQMQCTRLLRKAIAYSRSPDALSKHDLAFEIKVIKQMLCEKGNNSGREEG